MTTNRWVRYLDFSERVDENYRVNASVFLRSNGQWEWQVYNNGALVDFGKAGNREDAMQAADQSKHTNRPESVLLAAEAIREHGPCAEVQYTEPDGRLASRIAAYVLADHILGDER